MAAELAHRGEITLAVKVIPKSSRSELAGVLPDGCWRVKVAAAPEKGRANAELCAFLAQLFRVPKTNVGVRSGHTSALKRVRIQRNG